jgi:FkbM family methyltransferase
MDLETARRFYCNGKGSAGSAVLGSFVWIGRTVDQVAGYGAIMSRVREIALRVANAGLLSALSAVQRRFDSDAVYKVSKAGVAAYFEDAWFAYHPREFGSTGNIDFVPEAENETRNALFARLAGNEIFYDIGAHGGVYTVTLRKRFPKLIVHSFEPQPEDLLENLGLNGLSADTVHAVAVGDSDGTVQMTTNARSSNHVSSRGGRTVPMVRLDDYAREKGLPAPSWIKIDIEGFELPALRSAERLLREGRPTIICEINHLFNRYGSTIGELLDFMSSVGLRPHRLQNGELQLIPAAKALEDLGYSADNNFWFKPEA